MASKSLVAGIDCHCVPDLPDAIGDAVGESFEFVLAPLFHPRMHRDTAGVSDKREGPATRSDMVLDSSAWSTSVVGKASPWLDLDSPCEAIRRDSEACLKQEVAWASHLGVPAVCVRLPARPGCANLARALNAVVQQSDYIHFWVRVPVTWECAGTDAGPGADVAGAAGAAAAPRVATDAAGLAAVHTASREGATQEATTVAESLAAIASSASAQPAVALAPGACIVVPPALPEPSTGAVPLATNAPAAAASSRSAASSASSASSGADSHPVVTLPRTGAPATPVAAAAAAAASAPICPRRPATDPWEAWNTLRALTGFNPQVSACLELTRELPSPAHIRRWLGEPVKALVIPTWVFVTNRRGFSVLPRAHQAVVQSFMRHKAQIVVTGRPGGVPDGNGISTTVYAPYLEYLSHLASKLPEFTDKDDFEEPYYDYLQAPLQPLMDNLESSTYETFERDPIKYELYGEAVRRALLDRPADSETVLMVVGAGRGPLVRRSLAAAAASGRTLRVYAVEKNPNAKADILVSELLGSFGDNELSPECLDGAQKFLKEGGISIPASYTSFAAPVMSSKLWNEVKGYKEATSFETGYVVRMHNFTELATPQPCHSFVHPNRTAGKIDNSRYSANRFTAASSAVVHGFGGYFECVLYKDVVMSINPATHSEGMFSWFPIFFPIKQPFYVSEGDTIELHLWRRDSSTKVWYEWAFTAPEVTEIHNPGGRSYWIGL
ncbi:hypothetical protein FNF31_05334 [Cafeteria roenbergensis]|uniref:Protein arginine N-methyltransferase n=1 Tax=Cafeteria roenbergensis TaxID=33653 RepID=A0A5A8CZN4_CAFRO|nr:hypothetical protein FNF31_05334 [Cafeteria roenbergensis]